VAEREDRIELHYLPPYSPEANPDEWLNRDLKTELRLRPAALDKTSLKKLAEDFMSKISTVPGRIVRYFKSAPIPLRGMSSVFYCRVNSLYRNSKTPCMQGVDQFSIELKQRFASRHHHKAIIFITRRPKRHNLVGQTVCRHILTAQGPICSDKIRVAELADGGRTVLFAPRPQVAPREPAKHGRHACLNSLALQGIEDLFD
jgi:hypothetical protein